MSDVKELLARLDALRAKATQGEWEVYSRYNEGEWRVRSVGADPKKPWTDVAFDDGTADGEYGDRCTPETRDYIIALHNSYEALASELRRLAEENQKLTRCLRNIERIGSPDGEPSDIGPEAAIDLAQTFARAALAAAGEKGAGK